MRSTPLACALAALLALVGCQPLADAPLTCDQLCAPCDPAGDCAAVCQSLRGALAAEHVADWMGCFAADACDPTRARRCIDDLSCLDEALIGAHCDVLARCAIDGRGMLDEAECRAHPYHEPSRWGCLRPDRRERVRACLVGQTCAALGPCLDNAVCAGDGMCGALLATSLTVDCHRVCSNARYQCVFPPPATYGDCWNACDRAARSLADPQRRAFEACAVDEVACPEGGLLPACLRGLECDAAPLAAVVDAFAARCGARDPTWRVDDWGCLGHVKQAAMVTCFEQAPCEDIGACLDPIVRCADDAACLSFLDLRR